MQRKLAWDDLSYVLAVGRCGTLSGAARSLEVNHSTVFRRIGGIEEKLGVRLFDRRREGYSLTTAGEAVVAFAESLDLGVTALERRLAGEDLKPQGTVRLTTSDTLAPILMGILSGFRKQYPEIRLELAASSQILSLSRRDADIALRPTMSPESHLFGRKLASIAYAVYGSKDYLAKAGGAELTLDHSWIGLDDGLSHLLAYKWLSRNARADRVALSASSLQVALIAAGAGMGLALLPCYMARSAPELIRCSAVLTEVTTDLWMLVHEDLRKATRIRALMDFLAAEITTMRPIFEHAA